MRSSRWRISRVLTRAMLASTRMISERNEASRVACCTGAAPNRERSTERLVERKSVLEGHKQMSDLIEDLQLRTRPPARGEHIDFDEITRAFVESIEPLRQLADLASGYSRCIDDGISGHRKRGLERVGIRAVDLVTELVSFVSNES
jgi:hypothetical protein